MRVLFVSDLHGASLLLRKTVTVVRQHNIDVLFLAGDLSGKDLYPIIDEGNGSFTLSVRGEIKEVDRSGLGAIEQDLEDFGHYFFLCKSDEFKIIKGDEKELSRIMNTKIIERLQSWSVLLSSTLKMNCTKIVITPGNDDILEIDKSLQEFHRDGIDSNSTDVIDIGPHQVITLDYSNPTPWDTPREVDEKRLWQIIKSKVSLLRDPSTAIFNFHVPPYNTRLDLAPELDKKMHPVITPGTDGRIHVGSKSVRRAIEEYQPILGLHGHIHESPGEERIGRTICLNPGSEYNLGMLSGYIIDLNNDGTLGRYFRIEG